MLSSKARPISCSPSGSPRVGDDHAGAAPAADEADFLAAESGEDEDEEEADEAHAAEGVDADDAKVDELEARATGTLMAGSPARLAGTVIRSSGERRRRWHG